MYPIYIHTYTASSFNSDWLNDDGEEVATTNDGVATASDSATNEPSEQETAVEPSTSIVQKRRGLLDEKLKEFRQEKLKRKLPMDAQLLDCAREELQIKKRLIEHMDKVDEQHSCSMVKLSNNMEKLTDSIADGFSLLRNLFAPQPQTQPMYPPYHYSNIGDPQQSRLPY
jgi:hypothetical protein